MNKVVVLSLGLLLALFSCSCSKANASDDNVSTTNGAKPNVVTMTDDSALRPGMKPETLTIIDFNATWCGPCKIFKPVFYQASARFPDVRFISADVDNLQATAMAFGIRAVPTVIFIKPDGSTSQYIGTEDIMPEDKFFNLVQKHLK